ncbi:amino acid adenylation domain-containing protein [Stagonosporopsis vannaccii]|nr:amino acid adenylation domain-containing protein [Stagonosporopsis vannaccii]
MGTNIEESTEQCNDRSLNQTEHCRNGGSLGEQSVCSEGAHAQCGTDSTSESPSALTNNKESEPLTLDFQTGAEALALPPDLSTATVDEEARLPQKRAIPGRWRRFCFRWLTTYRILGSSIVVINFATLVFQVLSSPTAEVPLTATAANIMAAVLMRQEEVINLSFKTVSKLPLTLPLGWRSMAGDLHHYGGVHVGCALSALMWYITFAALNTVRVLGLISQGRITITLYVDIATGYTALLAILLMCVTAIPYLRVRCHNTFETTHRFGGWAALLVLWIHAGISTLTPDASMPLYAHSSLWLIVLTTLLIILPWLRIRRVPITIHPVSEREVQVTFPYTNMPHTSTLRTSTTPLTEWHAFATIPINDRTTKILISRAGDWTTSLIASPPSHLWIRKPPTLNFLAFAPLFSSLLLVATGAGIGPLLSLLAAPSIKFMRAQRRKIRVMWCVADPNAAHWAFVLAAIRDVDGGATLFDSRVGRPVMAFEARELASREGLEAVMVVSNPRVTREVIAECRGAGVAAYGAVFDS